LGNNEYICIFYVGSAVSLFTWSLPAASTAAMYFDLLTITFYYIENTAYSLSNVV